MIYIQKKVLYGFLHVAITNVGFKSYLKNLHEHLNQNG